MALPSALDQIKNVDYVVLLCDDWTATRAFYADKLGLAIERELPHWVEFRVGAVLLTLRPRGRSYDPPAGGVQLAFKVDVPTVDAWYEQLSGEGVDILEPPQSHDYGHRTLFFRDPEGNVLEIYADLLEMSGPCGTTFEPR